MEGIGLSLESHRVHMPFIKHKVLPLCAAFSSPPKGKGESSLKGMVQGPGAEGGDGLPAILQPNLVGPPPSASLAANRVASEPLCELPWGLGCGLMGGSNGNVYSPYLG